jgi:PPOX class probable F420-dependent enzyme
MKQEEALARASSARVARMATVDRRGGPHVMPVTFVLDGRVLYWAVDDKRKRSADIKRLDNIRASAAVQLVVDHFEEDWTRLWWVRLTGRGRILEEGNERRHALALLSSKYEQYEAHPPRGPVVAVDIDAVSAWEGA